MLHLLRFLFLEMEREYGLDYVSLCDTNINITLICLVAHYVMTSRCYCVHQWPIPNALLSFVSYQPWPMPRNKREVITAPSTMKMSSTILDSLILFLLIIGHLIRKGWDGKSLKQRWKWEYGQRSSNVKTWWFVLLCLFREMNSNLVMFLCLADCVFVDMMSLWWFQRLKRQP